MSDAPAGDELERALEVAESLSLTQASSNGSALARVKGSEVAPSRIRWAWEGWLPLGCVSLLAGMPDQGKSQVATDLVAQLTRGDLTGDLFETPSNAIVAMVEDPTAEVVVPRLMAAGAVMDRVSIVTFDNEGFDLSRDLERLQRAIVEDEARMIVIDPIMAYIPMSVDSHKDQHARSILAPLAQLAEAEGAAIVAVMHVNKNDGREVLARVSGSIGFVGAARALLFAGPDSDTEDESAHILAHGKSNLARKATPLRYEIRGVELPLADDEQPARTSRVVWTGEAEGIVANDLLLGGRNDEPGALEEAKDFLREYLSGGQAKVEDITRQATALGISKATLRRARLGLKLKVLHPVVPGPWYWEVR